MYTCMHTRAHNVYSMYIVRIVRVVYTTYNYILIWYTYIYV